MEQRKVTYNPLKYEPDMYEIEKERLVEDYSKDKEKKQQKPKSNWNKWDHDWDD